MKKTILIALAACLLAFTPAGDCAGSGGPDGFRPLVRHALDLKEQKRYAEAAAAVERALAMDTVDTWPGLDYELARLYLLAGEYDLAIGTCEEILGERPGDREARRLIVLVRARAARAARGEKAAKTETGQRADGEGGGLLARAGELEAERDYSRAAEAMEEAAASSPGDAAGVEREAARLHAWSGDYERAIALYREVLDERPDDRVARRGLARTYAWAKDYDHAVAEFTSLIDEDGEDMESRLGLARVLSWQGRYDESVEQLEYVLARDPGNTGARRAYARVLWWRGDPVAGRAEARALVGQDPGDTESGELLGRLRAATGPRFTAEVASASDSDDNELDTYRARVFAYLHRLSILTFDYSHYEASRNGTEGTARVFGAANAMEPFRWLRVTPRLRLVSLDSDSSDTTYLAGGLSVRVEPSRRLRLFASSQRFPLVDTAQLIRNEIRLDDYSVAALYDLDRLTLSVRAFYGEYSDGNTRKGLTANGALALVRGVEKAPDVTGGYRVEYREFSERTSSGYFNPPEIVTHNLYLDVKGTLGSGRVEYNANGRVGTQSYESNTEFTSAFRAVLAAHLTESLTAGAAYKWSRSALATAAGFRYEELRFTLDFLY